MCQVIHPHEREYEGDLVTVTIEDADGEQGLLTCTGGHPFWVADGVQLDERPTIVEQHGEIYDRISEGGRWTEARWLRLGDQFVTRTGKSATVVGLEIRLERERVYNLAVADRHTYAVGGSGVLVHNTCRVYHVYAAYDSAGHVYKIGYSGAKNGVRTVDGVQKSVRAMRQASKLTRKTGALHDHRILGTYKSKAEALAAERRGVERWTYMFRRSLPGNKYLRFKYRVLRALGR